MEPFGYFFVMMEVTGIGRACIPEGLILEGKMKTCSITTHKTLKLLRSIFSNRKHF